MYKQQLLYTCISSIKLYHFPCTEYALVHNNTCANSHNSKYLVNGQNLLLWEGDKVVQVRIVTQRNLNFSFNGELNKGACMSACINEY